MYEGIAKGLYRSSTSCLPDFTDMCGLALPRYGIRVNTISAGPLQARKANAIEDDSKTFIERATDYSINNAPLSKPLYAEDVGTVAMCLLSRPLC